MGRRRCPIAFFESPVARWDAKSELPVVGNPTTEMGLCRTDTGQVIDAGGVTPKRMKLVRFRVSPGISRLKLSRSQTPVSVRPPLIPDWPRESDASAKEAQVGGPGREPPGRGDGATEREGRHPASPVFERCPPGCIMPSIATESGVRKSQSLTRG